MSYFEKTILADSDAELYDVQNPIPTDGDSLYEKDIKVSLNNIGTFSGTNADVTKLFNNIDDGITDSSVTNPKWIEFFLERPQTIGSVGVVAHTGNFSNVKIILKDRQGTTLSTADDSSSNTKYTAHKYSVTASNFCCMRIEFHTADTVNLSFLRIPKDTAVDARIKALKPDGTETEVNATAGGNLKFSLEEYDTSLVDSSTSYPIFINSVHAKIHDSNAYTHSAKHTITSGSNFDVLMINPASNYPHFRWQVKADSSPLDVYIYENTAVSANGTAISSYNNNRNSANTANLLLYHTPTITTIGDEIEYEIIADGGGGGGQAGGGRTNSIVLEWILKTNTKYLMRITNNAVGSTDVSHKLFWYE